MEHSASKHDLRIIFDMFYVHKHVDEIEAGVYLVDVDPVSSGTDLGFAMELGWDQESLLVWSQEWVDEGMELGKCWVHPDPLEHHQELHHWDQVSGYTVSGTPLQ